MAWLASPATHEDAERDLPAYITLCGQAAHVPWWGHNGDADARPCPARMATPACSHGGVPLSGRWLASSPAPSRPAGSHSRSLYLHGVNAPPLPAYRILRGWQTRPTTMQSRLSSPRYMPPCRAALQPSILPLCPHLPLHMFRSWGVSHYIAAL